MSNRTWIALRTVALAAFIVVLITILKFLWGVHPVFSIVGMLLVIGCVLDMGPGEEHSRKWT